LPELKTWTALGRLAPVATQGSPTRASYMASTLSAGLELVKEGSLEAQQLEHFAEIYLRARMLEAAE
jgi:segregation and condensation protein A